MAHLKNLLIIVAIATLAGACGKKEVNTTPTRPGTIVEKSDEMSLEEAIIYLETVPPNETSSDKKKREIALRKAQKEEKDKLERVLAKDDIRVEREAAREIEREEERQRDREREKEKTISNAAVSGCSADTKIVIQPRATGSHSFTSYVKVRVVNLHSQPINIEDESGVIVEGLCANGSMTLFRARKTWTDGGYYSFRYIARGFFPDGTVGIQNSQDYRLSAQDVSSGRSQQFFNWNVQLRKVLPPR